jgi:hypothetical protein
MTPLQLELTKLIGRKDLTKDCLVTLNSVWQKYSEKPQKWRLAEYITEWKYLWKTQILTANNENRRFKSSWEVTEIIGHPATLSDFHRFLCENYDTAWYHNQYEWIVYKVMHTWEYGTMEVLSENDIPYDSSKDLLDQDEETLNQIIELIKSN